MTGISGNARIRQVSFYVDDAELVLIDNASKSQCKTRAKFCYEAVIAKLGKLEEKVEVLKDGVSESGSGDSFP